MFLKVFFISFLCVYSFSVKCQTDTTVHNKKYNLIIIKGDFKTISDESKKLSGQYPDIDFIIRFKEPYYYIAAGDCSDIENINKTKELLKPNFLDSIIEECSD
jgi:hypothetical protein